ncbi:MAG: hypothetical protein KBD76_09705 [Bacteriovorax sp.]|nr:hypothetical protein [Bacteriovorax sp.]
MGAIAKKRILILKEQDIASVGAFFQDLGFEICQDDDGSDDYAFVINQNYDGKKNVSFLNTLENFQELSTGLNQSFFDSSFLSNKNVLNLLKSYFSFTEEFDLVDKFSQKFKNIYTIKIQDSLNIGHLIDIVAVEAYKNQFMHEDIRDYLHVLLRKSLKMIEGLEESSPIDLSFSYSDVGFAVEFSFIVPPSLLKKEVSSLKEMRGKSHFYELSYAKKRERLVISSLWFKDKDLKTFKSYFFSEKVGIRKLTDSESLLVNVLDQEVEFVTYQANEQGSDQSRRIHLARKFCFFIKKVRKMQEEPVGIDFLTTDDIDTYLEKYPKKDALNELDLDLKKFILKMLKDEEIYEGVSEYVTRISQSNLNPFVEEVQKILGEKSLEDISEIFKVKGINDLADDVIRIKGVTDVRTDEEWELKKTAIIERIKDEVTLLKGQDKNIVESDIIRVVASELEASIEDVQVIVASLIEEAILNAPMPKEHLEEAFVRVFSGSNKQMGADLESDKLTALVIRQKETIERMSGELDSLRDEIKMLKIQEIMPSTEDIQMAKFAELKRALTKSVEVIRAKDKFLTKLKEDHEKIIDAKDLRYSELEARIDQLHEERTNSEEHNNKEKIEKLQNENRALTAKLELALRKINIINGNIDRQDHDSGNKKDKDVVMLKNELHMAQTSIEQYKQECTDLEYKLIQEKEKLIKLRDEKATHSKSNTESEEALITSLASEKRGLEEKLKQQVLENKKMEQKLKYSSAQLEESKKKKGSSLMSTVNTKNNDNYIKQIDNLNGRMQEVSTDLVEKKKEIFKLKQENVTLVAALSEMEKKISSYEKKAS